MQRIFSLAIFLCDLNLSAPIRRLTNIKAKNPRLIHVFIPQIARLSREVFAIIGIPHRAANKQSNRNTVQTERACSPACGIVSSAARCRRQTRLRRASITPDRILCENCGFIPRNCPPHPPEYNRKHSRGPRCAKA